MKERETSEREGRETMYGLFGICFDCYSVPTAGVEPGVFCPECYEAEAEAVEAEAVFGVRVPC